MVDGSEVNVEYISLDDNMQHIRGMNAIWTSGSEGSTRVRISAGAIPLRIEEVDYLYFELMGPKVCDVLRRLEVRVTTSAYEENLVPPPQCNAESRLWVQFLDRYDDP